MPSRRATSALALAAVAGGVVARRSVSRRISSWDTNHDTCDGDPCGLPDGEAVEIRADDGAVLHGVTCGEGPTVMLVHCWTGDRTFWAPVARRLVESGMRVLLVDQRGHGASERGTAPYLPETLGGDVRSWIEQAELDEIVLAGHSMGGLASMAFAIEHGELAEARLRAMVLVATLASRPVDPRLPDFRVDISRFLPVAHHAMRPNHYGLFGLMGVFGTRPARSQLDATRAGFVNTDPIVRREAAAMMMAFDLRERLEHIRVPTHVIAGSHDRLTPLAINEAIADRIPGARLEVLPGLGHMLPWEAPDQITETIVQAAKAD